MIVPNNLIQSNKYTAGNEYRIKSTNAPYKGYYYELNGFYYAGLKYNSSNPELIHVSKANTLFNNKNTAIYSAITGITSQQLQTPKINTVIQGNTADGGSIIVRYFCRKINVEPIIIKEIDSTTYNQIKPNPMYETTFIGNNSGANQTAQQAFSQLKGLERFLSV